MRYFFKNCWLPDSVLLALGSAKIRHFHILHIVDLHNVPSIRLHFLCSAQHDAAGRRLPSGIYGSQTWPWTTSKPGEGVRKY